MFSFLDVEIFSSISHRLVTLVSIHIFARGSFFVSSHPDLSHAFLFGSVHLKGVSNISYKLATQTIARAPCACYLLASSLTNSLHELQCAM